MTNTNWGGEGTGLFLFGRNSIGRDLEAGADAETVKECC